ncbi:MAG: biotin-dependent carboxyltransferase family protein [Acidobacteria bacterium]|nr:biotin-dependent carboxyltransferase family protein [Acidobacteriota bacterium]
MAHPRPHSARTVPRRPRAARAARNGRPRALRGVAPVIRVDAPGLLTTVQDLGRPGCAHLGVSASGAADALALRIGNRLVGNPENTPALEMTLTGGVFAFASETVIALTGSDFGAPLWKPFVLRAGESLRLGSTRSGARCYLSVRGGIDAPRVLGSASTHVLSGLGGRPLRKGDVLAVGPEPAQAPLWRGVTWREDRLAPLRVTRGPQADWFASDLGGRLYQVKEESNRMGLRLSGPKIERIRPGDLLTEGVPLGAIQVPPEGEPVILFVEHQTTGGYPKIAAVVSADLWRVGQLRPRDEVRFENETMEEALALLRAQEAWIRALG